MCQLVLAIMLIAVAMDVSLPPLPPRRGLWLCFPNDIEVVSSTSQSPTVANEASWFDLLTDKRRTAWLLGLVLSDR